MWKRFWHSENRFANTMATFVLMSAFGLFGLLDDPQPVGADPIERKAAPAFTLPVLASAPAAGGSQAISSEPVRVAMAIDIPAPGGVLAPVPEPDSRILSGKWALQMSVLVMQGGIEKFGQVPYYKSKLFKQECVNGSLLEGQDIDLKMGHAPFSVYMKFRSGDKGRQAIYVDGQHDNCLLVQPGGVTGRLSGTLKMGVTSDLVMAENRYPVTKIGLVELARTIVDAQVHDLRENIPVRCEFTDEAKFEDRPCYRCVCQYDSSQHSPVYRKSEMLIDREWSVPVEVKNYGWGAKGEAVPDDESLIEHYAYTEIEISDSMGPGDFDPKNKKYYMRLK